MLTSRASIWYHVRLYSTAVALAPACIPCSVRSGLDCDLYWVAGSCRWRRQELTLRGDLGQIHCYCSSIMPAAWRSTLKDSLDANKQVHHHTFMQLATVRTDGRPSVRTVVFRGFYGDADKITFATDTRHAQGTASTCSMPCMQALTDAACLSSGDACAGRSRWSTCRGCHGRRSAGTSQRHRSSTA